MLELRLALHPEVAEQLGAAECREYHRVRAKRIRRTAGSPWLALKPACRQHGVIGGGVSRDDVRPTRAGQGGVARPLPGATAPIQPGERFAAAGTVQRQGVELERRDPKIPFDKREDGRPKARAGRKCFGGILRRRTPEECTGVVITPVIGGEIPQQVERGRGGPGIRRMARHHGLRSGVDGCPRSEEALEPSLRPSRRAWTTGTLRTPPPRRDSSPHRQERRHSCNGR